MNRRGLILVPEFTVNQETNQLQIRNLGGASSEALVRQNLPYWDAFDLPDNPIIATRLTPSLEFLQAQGIVQKTNARPAFGGAIAEMWVRAQLEAFRINEEKEPGVWTLAQHGDKFWLPQTERIQTRAVEAILYRALPVPNEEISFEDILYFKQRRTDELQALRAELDDLHLHIVSQSDIPRATSTALNRLEKALIDIDKATTEAWPRKLRSSLKLDISLSNIAAGAMGGASVAASFALPIAAGAGLGAAGAILKFELKPTTTAAKPLYGLTYARKVETELGRA